MGPGTPAMRGIGRGTAKLIQDGRWIAGDYEQDQFLADGTFVLKWHCHVDGDRLVFESMAGTGTRLRSPGTPWCRASSRSPPFHQR
jgi:hypothetical protein